MFVCVCVCGVFACLSVMGGGERESVKRSSLLVCFSSTQLASGCVYVRGCASMNVCVRECVCVCGGGRG